jgi:hypothetical protein
MAQDNDSITTYDSGDESPAAVLARLALPLMEDLPNPIPLAELTKDPTYELIKRMVSEVLRCNTITDGMELITRLRLYKQLSRFNSESFAKYFTIIKVLKFVTLANRKETEIIKLFNEGLVLAIRNKIDVAQKIQDKLETNQYPYDEVTLLRSLIFALENSPETIGRNKLTIADNSRAVEPTISNWLKDFQVVSRNTSGGVGRALYFSKSANLKASPKDDQDAVLAVIGLYDYLREQVSRLIATAPDPNLVQAERFGLPENIKLDKLLGGYRQEDQASPVMSEVKQQAAMAMPAIAAIQVKPVELSVELPRPMAPPPLAAQPPRQPAPGIVFSPEKPAAAQAAPQSGQMPDIRQIRQEIEKKKEEAQKQIDTKLDDLKKRQEK